MFARNLSFRVKSNMLSAYTQAFDKDILPLLRRQSGFRDEITFSPRRQRGSRSQITFSGPGGTDVTLVSLWDDEASAETYNSNSFAEVLKTMARFVEGIPEVETSDVVSSTLYKIAILAAA